MPGAFDSRGIPPQTFYQGRTMAAERIAGRRGITRKRAGKRWRYFDPRGREITRPEEIDRLNRIGLPPAYTDCWLSPDPDSPVQAIGYDARGRRQYRYHPDFRAVQEADKFDRCIEFGRRLPKLRAAVELDLAGDPYDRTTVIASVIRVLDECRIRVGNRAYARANRSFGATTLERRHMTLERTRILFAFTGKSGKKQAVEVHDSRVIKIVRKLAKLPGKAVFQYRTADGAISAITPGDINAYIQDKIGQSFSAKCFRTWHASAGALREAMRLLRGGRTPTVKELAEPVSQDLGNTPAIARKSYIHPDVLEAATNGELPPSPRPTKWLDQGEKALLQMHEEPGAA
ncbi:MAG: DNA topoisomerase IB [Novosphingobium sp.]